MSEVMCHKIDTMATVQSCVSILSFSVDACLLVLHVDVPCTAWSTRGASRSAWRHSSADAGGAEGYWWIWGTENLLLAADNVSSKASSKTTALSTYSWP